MNGLNLISFFNFLYNNDLGSNHNSCGLKNRVGKLLLQVLSGGYAMDKSTIILRGNRD